MRRISLVALLVALVLPLPWRALADDWQQPAPHGEHAPAQKRAPDNKKPAENKPPPPPPDDRPPLVQNPNDCAVAKAAARYVGYGYTHVISLVNGCSKPVECALWTDVDPEPRTTVSLRPGDTGEVVTRRGSPARDVTAFKECSFR